MMTVDLRELDRSFRQHNQDDQLAEALLGCAWVTVGVVDANLDPDFVALADSFDVLVGRGTESSTAIDVDDEQGVSEIVAELATAIEASPQAAVALVQLLRLTHDVPVAQALQAESLTYAVLQTGDTFQRWLASREQAPVSDQASAVETQLDGSTLRITLTRPERRNALNIAMRDGIAEALQLLDLDPTIDGAILAGAGSNFCAGGDLDEFGSTPSPAVGHQVRLLRSLPSLMHRVADRMRVHVHGSCVGAGIELPAFANSIIATPDATFRLPEIGFGLVPGAGGTVSVTRRCGRQRTAWLALTGRTIDARHALRWQLIDAVSD